MDIPKRPGNDGRRYVIAQVIGWGSFTVGYTLLMQLAHPMKFESICIFIGQNLVGLLLSHGYRSLINRWGWKRLSWSALFPRVLGAVVSISIIWTFIEMGAYHFVHYGPEENPMNLSRTAVFIFEVFNGVWLFTVWSLIYFGYHAFNRARHAEVDRWQLESTVKEAELRALKSQVNPHFIFNSLNTVRALIHEDPATAETMVTRLAALLRYALQAGQLETVSLERELAIVPGTRFRAGPPEARSAGSAARRVTIGSRRGGILVNEGADRVETVENEMPSYLRL